MNNGRKKMWWVWAVAGAAFVVLAFLIAVLVGVGIYNAPGNRMTRLLNLGDKYLTAQEYEQAVAAYSRAIEIDPKDTDAYLGLADAYQRMGDMQAAYETLESGYRQTGNMDIYEAMQKVSQAAGQGYGSGANAGSGGEGQESGGAGTPETETGGSAETSGPVDNGQEDSGNTDLAEEEMIVYFTWSGLSQGGTISDLHLSLEGTLDDGMEFTGGISGVGSTWDSECELTAGYTETEKFIQIKFLRTDGVYHLTLEDDQSMARYGDQAGISRAEVKILVITSQGEKELDTSDYLHRYPTGYWTLEMDIDHGNVQ
ncbi:MAG: tetratricopeptide repeat protein [Lachnospiraceae bacterium]|nr:tetratricopeptide repeat protein [Lachnospiraceae bacterium]